MAPHMVAHMDNENENDNTNTNEDEKKKNRNFVKPTIEEIEAHFKLIDYTPPDIAEKFFNYYEANGWKVGKNKMKNWHSACQTWKINGYDKQKKVGAMGIELNKISNHGQETLKNGLAWIAKQEKNSSD